MAGICVHVGERADRDREHGEIGARLTVEVDQQALPAAEARDLTLQPARHGLLQGLGPGVGVRLDQAAAERLDGEAAMLAREVAVQPGEARSAPSDCAGWRVPGGP